MDSGINIDYEKVLRLVRQLPEKDIEKLTITLQSEISSKKPSSSLQELLLSAPTWTEKELYDFNAARNHISKSRIA